MRGRDCLEHVLPQQVGRVGPELVRVLDEAPAVDVAHVRLPVGAQQVEAAYRLPEGDHHLACDHLLLRVENHGVALLLAAHVALHLAVHHGRLARLGVRVLGANGVDLDVGALRLQQLLVDVRVAVVHARRVDAGVKLARAVLHLAEEPLRATTLRARVVDVDVVVLARNGFLDERLADAHAVHLEVVLRLLHLVGLARVHHHVLGHGHARLTEQLVDLAPVEEPLLLVQVVEDEGLAQRDVCNRLVQREPGREEGDQRIDHRPLLDGLVEDHLLVKVDHLELLVPGHLEGAQAVHRLPHRL
mmetsp:Transcript_16239/g.41399  ORF Transcript_16239/g.41399 Transcript_16239/m.41399 type:complete len:302 (+) Transcript_16239:1383-2288(+)